MVEGLAILAFDMLQMSANEVWAAVQAWVRDGYARAPALMAGLALVALIPPLALAGGIINLIEKTFEARARREVEEPMRTALASTLGLGLPRSAWIVLEGADAPRRPVPREMLSFGREDDNDIRLEHATVHRHHAVLHRTTDAQFVIRDLSGPAGNGVKVNGQRVAQRSLMDGDRIEIGAVVVKFEAQFA
jgi:hypothetical protein